jgi:hypothetical protein
MTEKPKIVNGGMMSPCPLCGEIIKYTGKVVVANKKLSAESRVDLQKQLDDVFFKHCVEKHFGEIDWEP